MKETDNHLEKSSKTRTPDVFSARCPSRTVLDHVTSTWGTLVMVTLLKRTYRFSELRDAIGGVSEKMLAQTLRLLEEDGFVLRKSYPVIPPKVEYSLTTLGKSVGKPLEKLVRSVEGKLGEVLAARVAHGQRARSGR